MKMSVCLCVVVVIITLGVDMSSAAVCGSNFCQAGGKNDDRCYGCCVAQGCGQGGSCNCRGQCLCDGCPRSPQRNR